VPPISGGPIRADVEAVASGLNAPNDLTSVGDGRLFIVEQGGRIRLVKNNALLATPFLDLSTRLVALNAGGDERGLLGLAFHPGFSDPASPGYRTFYTYTSEPVAGVADFTVPNPVAFNHQSVVAEWQASAVNPDLADPATRREVLRIDEPQSNHNGGKLAFRPGEPYLYISLGDGGASNDVGNGHTVGLGNGQDLTNVLGKILRLDPLDPALTAGSPDPTSANGQYRVPATNPFINSGTAVHEIYAYGLRNPFRFSFDATTGRLIVGDVGQNNIEEVDFIEAGKNYGWNRKEGSFLFDPSNGSITPDPSPDPALTEPVLEYTHGDGEAIIGGFVSRGPGIPALDGKYVFGDFVGNAGHGRLFYSDFSGGLIQELNVGDPGTTFPGFIKGFGKDDNGELYALGDTGGPLDNAGTAYKLVPIPAETTIENLSTRLKVETGDNVLIGGFIVTGSDNEEVILRGIGPSLVAGGIPAADVLPNPKLELRDSAGTLLATNDNWMDSPQKDEILSRKLAPGDALESAIFAQLPPGSYTTILSDANGASGIGLVELYATDDSQSANPVNISTRGLVQAGDDVMIGGFILGGPNTRHLAIRAIGPSLAAVGITNPLLDPILELHDQNGVLMETNDNWKENQAEVEATGLAPSDDGESVIVTTLSPGSYTAIVRGAGGLTGIALVEAYDIP
jgi:glucose/arabinose dehydrogenase